jgi:hypothetical protein
MGKKKNPFFYIFVLTLLSLLPFVAFLLDKFLLKLDNSFLLFGEIFILTLGGLIAVLLILLIK